MRWPSGDQLGETSDAGSSVSRVWSEPSAFITYILQFALRNDANAMRRPSGDQLG